MDVISPNKAMDLHNGINNSTSASGAGGESSKFKSPSSSSHNHVNHSSSSHNHVSSKDHHRSSSSHKERDRDKERSKDRERSSSNHHHSSSSDRHKERDHSERREHKSSSSSSSRDKSKEHSSDSSKHRDHSKSSSSSDKHRSKDSDKIRSDKVSSSSSSSSKPKDPSSSSSSSHKEHRDKHRSDKHHSDRSKDVKKHSSSSGSGSAGSSSEHRDKAAVQVKTEAEVKMDRDKENKERKEKADKVKDKEREKERHKEGKELKEAQENRKDRAKDSDRHRDKHREKHKSSREETLLTPKEEPITPAKESPKLSSDAGVILKCENLSDDEEDIPLAARLAAPQPKRLYIADDNEDSEEEKPLAARVQTKKPKYEEEEEDYEEEMEEEDSEEDVPLSARLKNNKRVKDEDEDYCRTPKKIKKETKPKVTKKAARYTAPPPSDDSSPKKRKKKEEEVEVWKWWEEEKYEGGVKWKSLEHKGPVFAPPYEPLPPKVKFYYDGKHITLSEEAEEVATFYSKLLDHDYTTKEAFNTNFFHDWRKVMTDSERKLITDLSKCDFRQMHAYFLQKSEERKAMTKEEKLELKKKNEEMMQEYGYCIIDGHREKIGNFKIEPPGLFRGRGEHPKMGKLKKRVRPEDVLINCGKNSKIPQAPAGHRWKEVRCDNTVTWLASWTENVQGQVKYVMLNPSSKLKGEKDWQKYETARKLKGCVDEIRTNYRADWKSKEMRIRQRAVALYFIDKLALRAGNEKEEGETADTVGCCSLRVEHIKLYEQKGGQQYVVDFDFLGKDSIRYVNSVPVEKRVFKNVQLFMENKKPGDDLFDRLHTTILNKHLNELMEGLSAKVFRTFNASKTLQEQLNALTNPDDPIPAKILSYNRANRAVAILCNHQRAAPKTFDKSMENLQKKIDDKRAQVADAEKEYKTAKKESKHSGSSKDRVNVEKKKKALDRLNDQLVKLELQATDKEENKLIALGTSKLNYLDPRISVAWCKKWEIPIEKIYNKTQRDKFRWAIEMATAHFEF